MAIWAEADLYVPQREREQAPKIQILPGSQAGRPCRGLCDQPPKRSGCGLQDYQGPPPDRGRRGIEIQKAERLDKPIAYETLQANPDLTSSEPIVNNQGSLFRLTEQEYEIIRSLIDDSSVPAKVEIEP